MAHLLIPTDYAVVLSGGESDDSMVTVVRWSKLVVAADSGVLFLKRHKIVPDIVVGDFDSCSEEIPMELAARGSAVIKLPRDKDKTDTEMALDLVSERGFSRALVVGALGGTRVEHELANVFLLEWYARRGLDVILVSKASTICGLAGSDYPISGERVLCGFPGDWVSILPVTGEILGVTALGLKFPLKEATLKRGTTLGVSNEMLSSTATLTAARGFALVVATSRCPT